MAIRETDLARTQDPRTPDTRTVGVRTGRLRRTPPRLTPRSSPWIGDVGADDWYPAPDLPRWINEASIIGSSKMPIIRRLAFAQSLLSLTTVAYGLMVWART